MKTIRKRLTAAVTFVIMAGGAFATEATYETAPLSIFSDATPLLNTNVRVTGYLRWTFENRNLFPVGTNPAHVSGRFCLPVLIRRDDKALKAHAEKRDGTVVTIKGRIVDAAEPGMESVSTCKQQGIEVTSIE